MAEGREGDWECGICRNRNYAFRSFCNRCKQPRLLVDTKTPADSKWLPRIGDWICSGCSNNNYASRDICKKCGQPKEETAMPTMGMPGAHFPSYSHYFSRMEGLHGSKMSFGMAGNSGFQQSFSAGSGWGYMPYPIDNNDDISYVNNSDHFLEVPKGWRDGDWLCSCGFHNYSSRLLCKKCNEPIPTSGIHSSTANSTVSSMFRGSGTKRLASEEFANDWHKKRLNAGDFNHHYLIREPQHIYPDFEQHPGSSGGQAHGLYPKYYGRNLPNVSSQLPAVPTLLGKGAKQWRDGDWMCEKCNNHNFASRSCCNRCKTMKDSASHPVSVS